MRRGRIGAEVLGGVLLALALAVAVQAGAPPAVRIPLGLVVALLVPGMSGFHAVCRRSARSMSDIAVSLAAGVGVLAVLGIVLNLLPSGLTPAAWSLGLLDVSLALAAVCLARSGGALPVRPARARPEDAGGATGHRLLITRATTRPGEEVAGARALVDRAPTTWDARRLTRAVVPLVVCAVLLGLGAAVTLGSQRAQLRASHLTELWLTGNGIHQTVHLRNREGAAMNYRVVVSVQGRPGPARKVRLAEAEDWTTAVDVPAVDQPRGARAESLVAVSVYRMNEKAVYRQVHVNRVGS